MAKRIITEEDLVLYPDLAEQGLKVGEEHDFTEEDEVGGSKPPDTKEKPDRP